MFFIKSKVKFNWFPTFESNKKWQKYPLRTPYYFFFYEAMSRLICSLYRRAATTHIARRGRHIKRRRVEHTAMMEMCLAWRLRKSLRFLIRPCCAICKNGFFCGFFRSRIPRATIFATLSIRSSILSNAGLRAH